MVMAPSDDNDFLGVYTYSESEKEGPGRKTEEKGSVAGVASSVKGTWFTISLIHLERSAIDVNFALRNVGALHQSTMRPWRNHGDK